MAKKMGIPVSDRSIEAVMEDDSIDLVFDATGASSHLKHAPMLKEAGIVAVDLTPAAVGPLVVPVINLPSMLKSDISGLNVNMITCGGQATIPIVYAISTQAPIEYAEIVATLPSISAGPGTRQNIDEFTQTTARGIVEVGGAERGKAIILLNPADPPIPMNCTIYAMCKKYDRKDVTQSILDMVARIQQYIPGYSLKVPPQYDGDRIMVMIQVVGAGDYLPAYAGNLDVMTSAAMQVGVKIAQHLIEERTNKHE
jgi:acetaldehyde dehydrogenase